jgi:hypothetical protein
LKLIAAMWPSAAAGSVPMLAESTSRSLPSERTFWLVTPKAPLGKKELALLNSPGGPPLRYSTTRAGESRRFGAAASTELPRAGRANAPSAPLRTVRRTRPESEASMLRTLASDMVRVQYR